MLEDGNLDMVKLAATVFGKEVRGPKQHPTRPRMLQGCVDMQATGPE